MVSSFSSALIPCNLYDYFFNKNSRNPNISTSNPHVQSSIKWQTKKKKKIIQQGLSVVVKKKISISKIAMDQVARKIFWSFLISRDV